LGVETVVANDEGLLEILDGDISAGGHDFESEWMLVTSSLAQSRRSAHLVKKRKGRWVASLRVACGMYSPRNDLAMIDSPRLEATGWMEEERGLRAGKAKVGVSRQKTLLHPKRRQRGSRLHPIQVFLDLETSQTVDKDPP
jgi:hypothetical protein